MRAGLARSLTRPPAGAVASYASAAVDFDAGPRDHRGVVGGEKDGRARQIVRLIEPAERYGADEARAALVVDRGLAHERREHRRLRRDGRDRDHAHAVAGRL